MLNELANGVYWFYKLEQGGCGIVAAMTPTEAEDKVREAYKKHSTSDFSEEIEIYEIYQRPFDDAPDVIEIFEM